MDDLKYFVITNAWASRANPDGFLRTYRTGGTLHQEVFSFSAAAWVDTDFFLDHARGQVDDDFEEVPAAEVEQQIADKLRRKAERERQG